MKKEYQKHESFGQLSFSRVQCTPPQKFYGSELPQGHYIQMTLQESEVQRTLSQDWYHGHGEVLAQVRMTSGQFAEMITSLNQGSGTPCTVEIVGGEKMEPLPTQESAKELTHREFQERMSEFAKTINEKQSLAKELVKKKTLSKQDIHDLTHHIEWLSAEISKNIPYFATCFQETMDKVVFDAKTEVENAIQHKISVLGLNALHEQNKLIEPPNDEKI